MPATLVTILGALGFFALILLSVGFHELGHFIPGKLFKVKVLQFFLGFGKNIWKTKRGETEYGVKMLPLGGYVLMQGMYPPKREGKNTWLKRVADSAREAEWEDITQEDIDSGRLFYQKPLWQRMIVMFSGVLMNILLAFFLFLGVNMTYGMPQTSMEITRVQACLDPSVTADSETCEPTPAAAMGLQVGDRILEFNGTPYPSWDEVAAAIRANGASPVQLVVERTGVRTGLPSVGGVLVERPDLDDPTVMVQVGFLGVNPGDEFVKVGALGTLKQMGTFTVESIKAIAKLPVTAFKVVIDMVSGKPRDLESPISIVGASVIAGQVAAADQPAGLRIAFYVQLLASVNLFVGLINLVPLPPFDGGQVAAGIYERIRRTWRKMRGREDPGPADTARLLPVTYLVGGLLILIGVVLILADIISPISLF